VRLVPRLAIFAEQLSLILDAETDEEKTLYTALALSVFGDPRQLRWFEPDDPPNPEKFLTRSDAEATSKVKEVWANILGQKPREKADAG